MSASRTRGETAEGQTLGWCPPDLAASLRRIRDLNGALGAVLASLPHEAETGFAPEEADGGAMPERPLAGMPVLIKDCIDTLDLPTTHGSAFFRGHRAKQDAAVVQRLRAAGALIIGKTNLAEFCLGGTTQNRCYGPCRNPWNMDCIPGGSSGGSAAAVAADMCRVAIGTDTGGSIRIPAALCGVAGLRPTLGSVPMTGIFPVSGLMDTVGPMAREVHDIARVLAVLVGRRPEELLPQDAGSAFPLAGLRLAVLQGYFGEEVEPEISDAVALAAGLLKESGASMSPLELPLAEAAFQAARRFLISDAAEVHAWRLKSSPELFDPEIRAWLSEGASIGETERQACLARRQEWIAEVTAAFTTHDLLLMPTVALAAPAVADCEASTAITTRLTRLTTPWAFAGVPALSLPCGFTASGLPIGLQLVAPPSEESRLIRAGLAFQGLTDWHLQFPEVLGLGQPQSE